MKSSIKHRIAFIALLILMLLCSCSSRLILNNTSGIFQVYDVEVSNNDDLKFIVTLKTFYTKNGRTSFDLFQINTNILYHRNEYVYLTPNYMGN